jgi:HSP20 family protein
MFGLTRSNSVDDVFSFQREIDRLFNQFWSDLPTRTAAGQSPSFQANTTDDRWRIDVPLPGIDPQHVNVEVAGSTLTIRAEEPGEKPGEKNERTLRYEQSFTVPQFLDLEKITASHMHGMLRLTVPLKESVKPRRIQIETQMEDQKQLAGARQSRWQGRGFRPLARAYLAGRSDADVFVASEVSSSFTADSTGSSPRARRGAPACAKGDGKR